MTNNAERAGDAWNGLYIAGAIAPLIALLLYVAEFAVIILGNLAGTPFPASTQAWFALLGVMFLALYVALRDIRPSAMLIAAYLAFLGIAAFVVPRVAMLSLAPLGERYAAAASDAARSQLLAAGEALGSLGTATPQTAGFFFISVATVIMSAVMLRGASFGRITAYAGIAAGILTILLDLSGLIGPAAPAPLLGIAGLFWVAWWILVARGLLRLGRGFSEGQT
jgi:hypothetical protein